jgi:hypothetical protein
MTWRTLSLGWLSGLVWLVSLTALPAQKAYDMVKYVGTMGDRQIVLEFADGYPEASVLKVREAKKTAEYHPDGSGEMRFVAEKKSAGTITLKMDPNEPAPATVTGKWEADGKAESFKLTKK